MRLQESGEMYLETIYILSQRMPRVRAIDVGGELGYSKPSVSRAVSILKEGGLLTVDGDGSLFLTPDGRKIAEKTYERHTVLTALFTSLGVPEKVAAEDACKIEHDISDETFAALKRHAAHFGFGKPGGPAEKSGSGGKTE